MDSYSVNIFSGPKPAVAIWEDALQRRLAGARSCKPPWCIPLRREGHCCEKRRQTGTPGCRLRGRRDAPERPAAGRENSCQKSSEPVYRASMEQFCPLFSLTALHPVQSALCIVQRHFPAVSAGAFYWENAGLLPDFAGSLQTTDERMAASWVPVLRAPFLRKAGTICYHKLNTKRTERDEQ